MLENDLVNNLVIYFNTFFWTLLGYFVKIVVIYELLVKKKNYTYPYVLYYFYDENYVFFIWISLINHKSIIFRVQNMFVSVVKDN